MTSKTGNRLNSKARRKGKTRNIFYQEIDRAIADVLCQIERLSNGHLKWEVEKRCENDEFLNIKWQHSIPTISEEQSRKFLYSDETISKKFFMHRELQRHQFKQAMKNKSNNHQNLVRTELDKNLQEFEKLRTRLLNQVYFKKYHNIIDRYPFLREIIQIISPSLSESQ